MPVRSRTEHTLQNRTEDQDTRRLNALTLIGGAVKAWLAGEEFEHPWLHQHRLGANDLDHEVPWGRGLLASLPIPEERLD